MGWKKDILRESFDFGIFLALSLASNAEKMSVVRDEMIGHLVGLLGLFEETSNVQYLFVYST